jgi:hypothetical protein
VPVLRGTPYITLISTSQWLKCARISQLSIYFICLWFKHLPAHFTRETNRVTAQPQHAAASHSRMKQYANCVTPLLGTWHLTTVARDTLRLQPSGKAKIFKQLPPVTLLNVWHFYPSSSVRGLSHDAESNANYCRKTARCTLQVNNNRVSASAHYRKLWRTWKVGDATTALSIVCDSLLLKNEQLFWAHWKCELLRQDRISLAVPNKLVH